MAKDLVERNTMTAIGNAIRSKLNSNTRYKPSEMPGAIASIPEGYPEPAGTISITQNGTQNVKDYASASVAVPNTYASGDEGKVVSNGALVAQTARSSEITANGTYDTTNNNSVTVNVSGGGGDDWTALKNYIQSSGTQYIDTGYTVKDTSRFELIADIGTSLAQYATLFGTRARGGTSASVESCSWFASNGAINFGNNEIATNVSPYREKKSKYTLFYGGSIIEDEEKTLNALTYNPTSHATTTYSLYLLQLNQAGSPYASSTACAGKIYRFRIYEGDNLVHEFVPWKDENDVVCLKDTVSGNLKYNAGTGSFVFGTDTD